MKTTKSTDFSRLTDARLELVAHCFAALSDPTRLKILRELKAGGKTVQELVGLFDCTQPNISRHLSVLSQAGLVKKTKQGSFVFHSITNPRIFLLCDNVCAHINSMLADYGEK